MELPAYRCWRSMHTCSKELSPEETFTCEYCGKRISEDSHPCGKYLLPDRTVTPAALAAISKDVTPQSRFC